MKNRTLILTGLGLNCEKETVHACKKSGADEIKVIHFLEFLEGKVNLLDYNFLIFIGGFLDGDHLGSARVAVNRMKFVDSSTFSIRENIDEFVKENKLILGICNGFQLLVKLGLLPDEKDLFTSQKVSLTNNDNGKFEDRWVHLKVNEDSPCIFTKGMTKTYLPVRHGEGKIVLGSTSIEEEIINNNLLVMQYSDSEGVPTNSYPENPNGSWKNVAGLCNQKGTIFGLMPHPEAYHHYTNHPHWTRLNFNTEDGEGLSIFKNAYQYLRNQ